MIFDPKKRGGHFFDIFDPPPLKSSKKWVSTGGGSGPKAHWGMRLWDNIMILQKVKLTIRPLGVGYSNRPKIAQNGGVCGVYPYMAKCLHCVGTVCILRTQRLVYSPKNTCHLFTRGKT